jgi:hypothetical protein
LTAGFDPEVREVQQLEVITGALRRRRWSAEAKARILAESLAPGVMISEAARRHDLRPQQLYCLATPGQAGTRCPIALPNCLEKETPMTDRGYPHLLKVLSR